MWDFQIKAGKGLRIDNKVVSNASLACADRVTASMVKHVKQAIVTHNAVASGGTRDSVRSRVISNGGTSGVWRRQVVAKKSLYHIQAGREAGRKMPVRLVGYGPRGGKVFEPLPALIRWFNVLGIERESWYPILRAIAKNGIKPKDIRGTAMRSAQPIIRHYANVAAYDIAQGLIKRA